jgi:hypothetical protein
MVSIIVLFMSFHSNYGDERTSSERKHPFPEFILLLISTRIQLSFVITDPKHLKFSIFCKDLAVTGC